jgi:hypothetical protein
VIQLPQQFSGLFDRLLEENDDLHQFINCSNAPAVALFVSQLLQL